ncbi:hypothetical protein YK48G_18480 [Lentilactobacillus fungorum]|uniref:Flavodoxin-like domain-containing protein n=1 Tax=Lentilactobacillus fungorum TaxID=2201250 RepID=A0ABQ3W1C2_9LACO|nr:flavodoxin domain-containing protein [Lentilactobacillus fungorum]GHP14423.1 hypothetical protein YK48G_18480 [Lentilactobacillus fungorum]
MKYLILYATKYGATKEVAEKLDSLLDETDVINIKTEKIPDVSMFDAVIIGSPVTAGMVKASIKDFINANKNELMTKPLGIYLCGLQTDNEEEYLEQNFPKDLLAHAKTKSCVGGIYDPNKCGFFARVAIKKVAKLTEYTNTLDSTKISEFAKAMTGV